MLRLAPNQKHINKQYPWFYLFKNQVVEDAITLFFVLLFMIMQPWRCLRWPQTHHQITRWSSACETSCWCCLTQRQAAHTCATTLEPPSRKQTFWLWCDCTRRVSQIWYSSSKVCLACTVRYVWLLPVMSRVFKVLQNSFCCGTFQQSTLWSCKLLSALV